MQHQAEKFDRKWRMGPSVRALFIYALIESLSGRLMLPSKKFVCDAHKFEWIIHKSLCSSLQDIGSCIHFLFHCYSITLSSAWRGAIIQPFIVAYRQNATKNATINSWITIQVPGVLHNTCTALIMLSCTLGEGHSRRWLRPCAL